MRTLLPFAAVALVLGCGARPASEPGPPLFYPAAPETPRLQLLTQFSAERDVAPAQGGFEAFVLGERADRELVKPYGVALHDGRLIASDTVANDLWILDLTARSIRRMGEGVGSPVKKPINVAVDARGHRYVTDAKAKAVLVFDAHDRFLRALGAGQTWTPSGLALHGERVYVTDVKGGRVLALDRRTGEVQQVIGHKGSGEGALYHPTNVAVDTAGNVYVADTGNFRVMKFSPAGEFMQQFGKIGRNLGQFSRPKGLAVDREGRVYVSDSAFDNVQIFDAEGRVLLFFGASGNTPGAINLPAAVTIDYDNVAHFQDRVAPGYAIEYLVLVVSQYGPNKINVFGFLRPTAGAALAHSNPTADR